jgi:hypothetical protein
VSVLGGGVEGRGVAVDVVAAPDRPLSGNAIVIDVAAIR